MNEEQPNNIFFDTKNSPQGNVPAETQFTGKGNNRQLKELWNVHFMMGSAAFQNLMNFMGDIHYDTVLIFRKKEILIIAIDAANTHAGLIRIERTELSDYEAKNLKDENDEIIILIDSSIIIDELSIDENFPIDFYVDGIEKNRFYVVCGKELVRKQLGTLSQSDGSVVKRHKNFELAISRFIADRNYQKIIVNSTPMGKLMKSLSRKVEKGKYANTLISLYLDKSGLDFRVENEVKGSSIVLSGEDIMVYPLKDDKVEFDLKFLSKFGKLKLTFTTSMYVYSGNLPLLLESRVGGGKIEIYYLIAPRVITNS